MKIIIFVSVIVSFLLIIFSNFEYMPKVVYLSTKLYGKFCYTRSQEKIICNIHMYVKYCKVPRKDKAKICKLLEKIDFYTSERRILFSKEGEKMIQETFDRLEKYSGCYKEAKDNEFYRRYKKLESI